MEFLTFLLGIFFLLPASLHDLRTREVPDLLSYGLIFFGLAFPLGIAWQTTNAQLALQTIVGGSIMLAIGALLYYAGQWGGADSKLLIGMGALLGFGWGVYDAAIFFLLVLFVGAGYGILYSVVLAFMNWKVFRQTFTGELRANVKLRRLILIVSAVFLVLVALLSPAFKILFATLAIVTYLTFNLWIIIRSVEKAVLIKKYPVSKLTEGDWVNEDVIVKGKKIVGREDLGVTKKQIALLKKSGVRSVIVKEGIPFVPSFFFALFVLYYAGSTIELFFMALI